MTDGVRKPRIVTSPAEAFSLLDAGRRRGERIGLVPTMGALHEGHLSLARAAREACDFTVVSIFVNPTQFAPHEDLAKYPRTFDTDVAALAELGIDLVFAPQSESLYGQGFSTFVEPPAVAGRFEGECRPGHFRGVTTIVLKLFNLLPAEVAFFGQKDYQQCLVIQRLVEDFNFPIQVQMCPTVREPDGLAMSSRNRYLNETERRQATALFQGLSTAKLRFDAGERQAETLARQIRSVLSAAGIERVDYAAIADARTLEPVVEVTTPTVALVAAYVGSTRLLDNALLG